ncbi:hypothetical protein FE697_010445 [Mumia zhuanghuii]|uniref:Bacteriocin biosynthesis cyclodehydratase domain-containing protein n=2 Tax=Mumia TaxID=1546255 RepID=A0ABW1QFE5_9ACTN|nr:MULTISPECIES: hypothetical protein [Mumia]KAA1422605.1 hypothetical protein FE697_010445 [Mumia zhuanghuii]
MKPLLRPSSAVVRRSPRALQIGTVPGSSVVVADAAGVSAVLRAADGTRDLFTIAATSGVPVADVVAAADTLVRSGAVVDAESWDDVGGTALIGEARALAIDGSPRAEVGARLATRAAARVEITCEPHTDQLAHRLQRILTDAGASATVGPVDLPALVVVISAGPSPREAFDVLTGAGVPHLPVVHEARHVRVGPLVRPGLTPCVRCDDVDRASYEPVWPLLLQQLARPIAEASPAHPHAFDALTGHTVALQLAANVLAYCDGLPTDVDGAVTILGDDRRTSPPSPVALQPDCSCQILSDGGSFDRRVRVARGVRMTA